LSPILHQKRGFVRRSYYNRIETSAFYELDLLGADLKGQAPGTERAVREDYDVVGNVIIHSPTSRSPIARIGGDGAGTSHGRYRFVNNTIILSPSSGSVFKMQADTESIEMHNNVFYRNGQPVSILYDQIGGRYAISGSNNWVPAGSKIPVAWKATRIGRDPGFRNAAQSDFTPLPTSELVNAGSLPTGSPPAVPFPFPLASPLFHPPMRVIGVGFVAGPRPRDGQIDIGAFESSSSAATLKAGR
jgi:hypothetical protein